MNYEGTFTTFMIEPALAGLKTREWRVVAKFDNLVLGYVGWFRWRRYCFFPADDCVFDEVCMREIGDFIGARTKEYKNSKLAGASAGKAASGSSMRASPGADSLLPPETKGV